MLCFICSESLTYKIIESLRIKAEFNNRENRGHQEGLFELAIQLRTFFIRLFATLQPDMFY
jgi:hypothetical protein